MVLYFIIFVLLCLIFLVFFSGGITISSTSLEFSSGAGLGFTIFPAILFPMSSPVASAALWTTLLEAVFRAASPYFLIICSIE